MHCYVKKRRSRCMYIQEWDKYQGLIEDKLHYSNILRIMRLSCQEKPHLIISYKSGLFHSQAPLPTNSKGLILKPYCNFIATLKQLYYNFITLQQLYDDYIKILPRILWEPSSLWLHDTLPGFSKMTRWSRGIDTFMGHSIFNCERSSSTIYQINLSVCVCHFWNSSFKCSPANQSTVWD